MAPSPRIELFRSKRLNRRGRLTGLRRWSYRRVAGGQTAGGAGSQSYYSKWGARRAAKAAYPTHPIITASEAARYTH